MLRGAGFQEVLFEAEAAREAHAGHVHEGSSFHLKFVEPRSGGLVELHGEPLQLGLRPADEAGRWRRAVPVPGLDGALMLSWEDQVIQLSVHAHKHGFERLIWLKDLDLLLRTFGDSLNWGLVETVARAEGVTASVWYALELASRLLGAPLPAEVRRRFRPTLPLRAGLPADLAGGAHRRPGRIDAPASGAVPRGRVLARDAPQPALHGPARRPQPRHRPGHHRRPAGRATAHASPGNRPGARAPASYAPRLR